MTMQSILLQPAAGARLPQIPASFFGMVLGLTGIGNAWRLAHRAWDLPPAIGETLMAAAILVWALLIILYAAKWLAAPDAARAELAHPVQCCFVGLIGVSTMLVAAAARPYSPGLGVLLGVAGILLTVAFAVWRTGQLWHGGRDEATDTAVLYLPLVAGSYVTASTLAALGLADWGRLAFGGGLFGWLAFESVLLHRLLTSPETAVPLRPTLGIQLAPPVVGAVAYLNVGGGIDDMLLQAMIGYGLLQTLLLLRLLPWVLAGGFTAGFWAFSFGVTALADAPLMMVNAGAAGAIATLAPLLFGAANVAIVLLIVGSLYLLAKGRLLPAVTVPTR
jgi:tellurite resistance protein